MMTHKHLHELLTEEQEPFKLKNYISDRRSQLKSTTITTSAAVKLTRRKPFIEPTTTLSFCINHACLFTFQNSPDVGFRSPVSKSPCSSANNAAVFLHVPARTSAMLLDAAMRIQKQSSSKFKPESSKNVGFGLFGSFLKRLKHKSSRTKRHGNSSEVANDVVSCSCNNSRFSSADWSEKSPESETSCSSISVHEPEEGLHGLFSSDKCFCSSSSTPFRFSLHKSPSSGHRTPDFLSPPTSPSSRFRQEKEKYDGEHPQEILVEEHEQCSPVSVLDPPLEEDEYEYGVVEGDVYDLESRYVCVQRAKHQLLQKLLRFTKLAELDPIELEKHMVEQCDNDEDDDYEDVEANTKREETDREEILRDICNHLGIENIPLHIKRLVLDLISEENENENENENEEHEEVVVKRVCRKLDSWEMVELNTIDMMVELELRREKSDQGWKRSDEDKVRKIVKNIEVGIMGILVEEFAQELLDID